MKPQQSDAETLYFFETKSQHAELKRTGKPLPRWTRWENLTEREQDFWKASVQAREQNYKEYNAHG